MYLEFPSMTDYVAAEAALAVRRTGHLPVDAAELEDNVLLALRCGRLRTTESLPELVRQHVLAWLDWRQWRGRTGPAAKHASPNPNVAAASDHCRARRQQCWPVPEGTAGRSVCRCRGRTPAASAWNGRIPWRSAAKHAATRA